MKGILTSIIVMTIAIGLSIDEINANGAGGIVTTIIHQGHQKRNENYNNSHFLNTESAETGGKSTDVHFIKTPRPKLNRKSVSVYFDNGSSKLSRHQKEKIKFLFNQLKPGQFYVVLKSFTSRIGSENINHQLREERNESIGKYIINLKRDGGIILTINDQKDWAFPKNNERANRRTEITITGNMYE